MSKTIDDKEEILSATNWAAASFLGIILPILGLVVAAIAGSKADKLHLKFPGDLEIKKIRLTALAGGIASVISLIAYAYYFYK